MCVDMHLLRKREREREYGRIPLFHIPEMKALKCKTLGTLCGIMTIEAKSKNYVLLCDDFR